MEESCIISLNQNWPEGPEGQRLLSSVFLSPAAAHQYERGKCSNKPFLMTILSIQAELERKSFHGFMSAWLRIHLDQKTSGQLLAEEVVALNTWSLESGSFSALWLLTILKLSVINTSIYFTTWCRLNLLVAQPKWQRPWWGDRGHAVCSRTPCLNVLGHCFAVLFVILEKPSFSSCFTFVPYK